MIPASAMSNLATERLLDVYSKFLFGVSYG